MFNGYSWQTRVLEVRPDRLPPDFDGLNPSSAPFSATSSPGVFSPPQASLLGSLSEIDYTSLFGIERPRSSSGSAGRNLFVGNVSKLTLSLAEKQTSQFFILLASFPLSMARFERSVSPSRDYNTR